MMATLSVNSQFAHAGVVVFFSRSVATDAARAARVAALLVDDRWPWLPWWATFQGVHKRDDRGAVKVNRQNGSAVLFEGFTSPRLGTLEMVRSKGDGNFTSVRLPFDRAIEDDSVEASYRLLMTCRSEALPDDKRFDVWITLVHDLVIAVGGIHATVGAWPTFDRAIADTWLTRVVVDNDRGERALFDDAELEAQNDLLRKWRKKVGRTYARHPRWGTYLNAAHVEAIGGVERIRAEVQPARIDTVGELTYIQLTESIDTGMSAEAGARRRALQSLMAPILLGARQPPS